MTNHSDPDKRAERRKERDSAWINRLSRDRHERDVRMNAEPKPFFGRRDEDRRSPKSKEFSKRWISQ